VVEHDLRGDAAEARRVAASLKDSSAILVALGPLAAQACREQAPSRTLVYGMVADPAAAGLVGASNVTGVSLQVPVKNQLAAFRMVNPRGVRVGVLYGPDVRPLVREAQQSAAVVRLTLVEREIASARDVPEALRALLSQKIDALWLPPDPILLADETRRFLMSETLKARLPIYGFSAALVGEGALVSDGPDLASVGGQLAELVQRLAAGEPTTTLGQQVPRAELVINKKIADQLGVEIPVDALRAAARVY
jgi:putative ABC transport system substrate-binding protein